MTEKYQYDLVVLAADRDMEATLEGLLNRRHALEIKAIRYNVFRHPEHDAGCRTQGVNFLRNFSRNHQYALLCFDLDGSGEDDANPEELERNLELELSRNGWDDRAKAIVINPELEIWIWSGSSQVDNICGWGGRIPSMRDWLVEEKYLNSRNAKPDRPKEAFRHTLREVRKQPSSSLFKKMAEKVSFKSCTDRAFKKFISTIQEWFPK